MGIVWFIVFFVVLYLIFSIVVGFLAMHAAGIQGAVNYQQGLQTGAAFTQAHAVALSAWRLIILVVSILLAVVGTLKGVLPGTRKQAAAAPQ
jgi:uncharacterized membrane protein YgdD (TMEM256/DUF423 family)